MKSIWFLWLFLNGIDSGAGASVVAGGENRGSSVPLGWGDHGALVPQHDGLRGWLGFLYHLIGHSLLQTVLTEWMQGCENY